MDWLLRFYRSTIGMKVVMGVTGFILVGFVLGHMAGNLQLFLGEETLNKYSQLLHTSMELLWVVRLTLLTTVLLHIVSFVRLRSLTAAARPIAYKQKQSIAATLASRSMALSGPVLLAFIIFHLLHMTAGVIHPNFLLQQGVVGQEHTPNTYANMTSGFDGVWMGAGAFYVVAMIALFPHLRHGVASMCRTLGLRGERGNDLAQQAASLISAAVVGGNILIVLAVTLGII